MENIIIKNLDKVVDVQKFFEGLNSKKNIKKRFFINYPNTFFKNRNWLEISDIKNILILTGYEIITIKSRWIIAKIKHKTKKDFSVSIVIPAKNESENIKNIISTIPMFGKKQEFIFVEGGSSDNTWTEIKSEVKRSKTRKVIAIKQLGKGKADAVRQGFKKSSGDILMIYDADRTVDPKDLVKFYNALSEGVGEFINGSRLVYPMEKDAMRLLNKIANKLFGIVFTKIFGQNFKDTLCGTKALFKKDYLNFTKFNDDPFGDFELIFGAVKNNLKIVEVPVKYRERIYGSTNIRRFHHGLLLLKIVLIAFWIFSIRKLFLPKNIR